MTCFEDLSNEIFYEIFDYLDIWNAYESFYDLNNRFQNIIVHFSLPYKINLDLISKTIFEQRYQYIIIPNKDRIISLCLSNWIYFDKFDFDSSFIHLESLILNEIKTEKLESILINLSLIPRLFSLSIITIGIIKDPNRIHRLIFTLPVLKYCNTKFEWLNQHFLLSNSLNEYSPIEYFISKSSYNLKNLSMILSYMPRLIRLSLSCCGYLSSQHPNISRSIILNNLTHFHLDYSKSFVEFEMFISNLFHRIQILRITSRYNIDYLDSNRWKQLIINYLPRLHTFDLQYFGKIINPDDKYQSLIDGFISSFWIERKWFFDRQYYQYNNTLWILFYSVKQTYSSDLNFFRHVVIENENDNTIIDLDSSQLTLTNGISSITTLSIDQFNQIIPLKQLKKLIVTTHHFNNDQLMKLLCISPNIQLLILSTYLSCLNSQQNKSIQQIIIIDEHLRLNNVQELINKYPNLKSLEMKIIESDLELIIRFILKNNSSLHLIGLRDAHRVMINRLEKVIHREELIQNYSIQYISDTAYLWW